jgi:hypothetical protein
LFNGIRFDDFRSTLRGVLHRSLDNPFCQAFAAQLATNEKADQRPYFFRRFANAGRTTKVTVSCSRSDRAPGNRLVVGVAEQPDWDAFANFSPHRRFPVWTLRGFCPGSPDHAPTGFWSTATLKQALKIIPARSVNFMKRDILHVAHDSDVSHSIQSPGCGSPAVCHLTSRLAGAPDFRATTEPPPKNGSRPKSQVTPISRSPQTRTDRAEEDQTSRQPGHGSTRELPWRLSWGLRFSDASGPVDGLKDSRPAVGGLRPYFPTPATISCKIVQWRAGKNKTANNYVIEIAL